MNDQVMIVLCGIYCLGFAVFHTQFWKLFNWRDDLSKLMPINTAIMQILNIRLIYMFILVGVLCIVFREELASTTLGDFFLGGMSLFWLGRAFEQYIFVKSDHPMSQLLTYVFLLGAVMFAIPVLVRGYS